jgi:hypothetical protein
VRGHSEGVQSGGTVKGYSFFMHCPMHYLTVESNVLLTGRLEKARRGYMDGRGERSKREE